MKCLFVIWVLCVTSFLGWVNASTNRGTNNTDTTTDARLKCYVCSWSLTANITNNVDTCSPRKFIPEAAAIHPCQHGCQTVSYRNAKNQALRHFFRNCLKIESGVLPVDRCFPTKDIPAHGLETRCECLTSLCNHSHRLGQSYFITITALIASTTYILSFIS